MRLISILIILVIGVSTIATSSFEPFAGPDAVSLRTLDVCHSATPVLNPDLPYISACPCVALPAIESAIAELPQTRLNPLILAFQDERPPKSLI